MNLFLTRRCDEGCAFCYARTWMGSPERPGLEALLPALEHYAGLVRGAGPPPRWRAEASDQELLAGSAGTVNLLGGEPALHPDFVVLVHRLRELGLGVNLFTAGGHPEPVRVVAEQLWFVTLNGRFVQRAGDLGVPLERFTAHLPLRPGDDVTALLEAVASAGLGSAVLAFAAPAGGALGPFFEPDDPEPMRAVVAEARAAASRLELSLGWDCAPPRCVLPEEPGRCLPVPVMDPQGNVSVCAGHYFDPARACPVTDFASLAALHSWALAVYAELEARPSPHAACRACPELGRGCHGMCLGSRGTR